MHLTAVCWLSRHSTFLCPMAKVGIFPIHLDPPTVEHRLLFRLLLGQHLCDSHELEKRVWGVPTHHPPQGLSSLHSTKNGCTMHPSGTSVVSGASGPGFPSGSGSSVLGTSSKSGATTTSTTSSYSFRRRLRASLQQEENADEVVDPHTGEAAWMGSLSPQELPDHSSCLHHSPHWAGGSGKEKDIFSSSSHAGKQVEQRPLPADSTRTSGGLNAQNDCSGSTSGRISSGSSLTSSGHGDFLLPFGHTANVRMDSRGSGTSHEAGAQPNSTKGRPLLPREIRSDLGYMDDFYKNISSFSQLVPFEELILIPSTKFPLSLSQSVSLAALTVLGTRGIPHLHIDFTALEHPDDSMPIVYQLVRRYPRGAIIHWLHDAYEMRSWAHFDWIKQTIPLLLLNTQSVSSYKQNARAPNDVHSSDANFPDGSRCRADESHSDRSLTNHSHHNESARTTDNASSSSTGASFYSPNGLAEQPANGKPSATTGDVAPVGTTTSSFASTASASLMNTTKKEAEKESSSCTTQMRAQEVEGSGKEQASRYPSMPSTSKPSRMTRWWRAPPPSSSSSSHHGDIVEVSKWYRGSLESSWLFNHHLSTNPITPLSPHGSTSIPTTTALPSADGGSSSAADPPFGRSASVTSATTQATAAPSTMTTGAEGSTRQEGKATGTMSTDQDPGHSTTRIGSEADGTAHGEGAMSPLPSTIQMTEGSCNTPPGLTTSPEGGKKEEKSGMRSTLTTPRISSNFPFMPFPYSPSAVQLAEDMMEEDIEWMQQAKQLEESISPFSHILPSHPHVAPPSAITPTTTTTARPLTPTPGVEDRMERKLEEQESRGTASTSSSHASLAVNTCDASCLPPPSSLSSATASAAAPSLPSSHSDTPFGLGEGERGTEERQEESPSASSSSASSGYHESTACRHAMPLLASSSALRVPGRNSPLEVGQLLRELYPTLWSIPSAFSAEKRGDSRLFSPTLKGRGMEARLAARRRQRQKANAAAAPAQGSTSTASRDTPSPSLSSISSPEEKKGEQGVLSTFTSSFSSMTPRKGKEERLQHRGLSSRRSLRPGRSSTPSCTSASYAAGSASQDDREGHASRPSSGEEFSFSEVTTPSNRRGGEEEEKVEREVVDVVGDLSDDVPASFPYVEVFAVTRHSGAEVRQLLWDQMADEARFLLTKTVWKYITTHGLYHNERRWSAAVAAVSTLSNAAVSSASSSFPNPLLGSGKGEEKDTSPLHGDPKLASGYFSFQNLHRSKKPFRSSLRSSGLLHIAGLVPRLELHYDKNNPLAQECYEALQTFSCPPGEEPDLIVPIGGDGYMLTCIREHWRRFLPFYGINAGHVGHLLNSPTQLHELFSYPLYLHSAIMLYCQCEQPPPPGSPPGTPSVIVSELAFNDAWVERSSGQTAHLRIFINGEERIHKLKGDGVLLSTAAGSTAYSRALGASPVPIGAPLIQIVGSNVVSPAQWRPAHLEQEDEVEIVVLDREKRPCRCFVDAVEVGNVQRMLVRSSRVAGVTLAYAKSCDLQSKLYDLQFPGSRSGSTNGW